MVSTSCLPKKCYPRLKKDLGCLIINYTCTVQLTRIDLVVILSCLVGNGVIFVKNYITTSFIRNDVKHSLFAYVNSMRFFKIIFKLHHICPRACQPNQGEMGKINWADEIRKLLYHTHIMIMLV